MPKQDFKEGRLYCNQNKNEVIVITGVNESYITYIELDWTHEEFCSPKHIFSDWELTDEEQGSGETDKVRKDI
jgi:hypothetical protein